MSKIKYQKVIFFILLLSLFLIFTSSVYAASDVVINEFSPATDPEWIEIYNPNEQTLSLKEVILLLDGDSTTTQKMSFCDNELIAIKSFRLISRPTKSFWLSNSGDTLILKRGDDAIDSISYGTNQSLKAPTSTQSAVRSLDGGSIWTISNNPTPQGDSVSFDCPTPTPTSTPTPSITPTPTNIPTNTPFPSATAKPQSTSTPIKLASTVTKIPSLTLPSSPSATSFVSSPFLTSTSESAVLGETTNQGVTMKKEEEQKEKKNTNTFSILLIILGSLCVGIACILSYRQIKKSRMKS